MNRITQKEFLQRLKNGDNLIMKELYFQWKSWLYREYKAYEYNENLLLIKGKDKYEVYLFIFNYDNSIKLLNKYQEDCNCTQLCVSIIDKLPEQFNKYYGFRCFERKGMKERIVDNSIKLLTKENKNEVFEFCNKLSNQGKLSKDEADSLQYYIENIDDKYYKNQKAYGYYEKGLLIGYVILKHDSALHYSMLLDIGVLEEYRRHGVGSKLSKFILSQYPNDKYLYQVAHFNKASIGLLTSLGFEFVGIRELMIKG